MDAELKAKWVKALRSGEYKQASGALRGAGGFCCLGVLCDVSGLGGSWKSEAYVYEDEGEEHWIEGELYGYAGTFGLTSEQETILIRMNDGLKEFENNRQTFPQIADYIERNL